MSFDFSLKKAQVGASDKWWKNTVFYELYVDKFAGNFQGLAEKIPYLAEFGIGCVHVLPHYPSPMVDDGYDISDYRNVRKELGQLEDFDLFIRTAHEAGVRVMVDFVLNHVSIHHPWFEEARGSAGSSKRNYFLWSKTAIEFPNAVNAFHDFKPKNWIYNPLTEDYYFSTFYPEQADLNWDNPEVFSEMMGIVDFWVRRGVDGFRLDAASHLIKREGGNSKSLPETHTLLKKIRAYLDEHYANIVLLAEVHEPIPKLKEYFGSGEECHLVYHFPLVEKMFLALKRGDLSLVGQAVQESSDIPENCQWCVFLRHHDDMSLETLTIEERNELVGFFDPERKFRFGTGISMRLASLLGGDKEKIAKAFEMLFNIPGSPIIYYGDEIGMENLPLIAGEKDTRRYVRGAFDWKLAEAERKNPGSLYNKMRQLIRERKKRKL